MKTPNGFKRTVLTTEKIAVFVAMPTKGITSTSEKHASGSVDSFSGNDPRGPEVGTGNNRHCLNQHLLPPLNTPRDQ